ncbi:MAG: hypothetical protein H0V61_10415 [Chitinophagales bacterium]|nr:hypothetical protein [Chitinophagales bacterium]
MTHNFTPNDLLRFLYRETTHEEDLRIKLWISQDLNAYDLFMQMIHSAKSLNFVPLQPSETSVSIILDYSRQTSQAESHV